MICARCNTPIPRGAIACPVCNAPAPPAVKRPYALYILGAFLVLGYTVLILLAWTEPGGAPPPQTTEGLMFWSGVFGYYRAKRLGGSRWKSAGLGALLGLLGAVVVAFIAGMRA